MSRFNSHHNSPNTALLIRAVFLVLALVVVFPTAPVLAQDDDTAEDTAEAEAEEEMHQESDVITVTARKREENIQEVPIAVTMIQGDALEDLAAMDISEIQASVPNLSIYPGRNQSTTLTAFMRGIGQADPLWGVDPGVGLYLDDVYIARPQGALLDVFDVQRIEVLRGPQGTLYGKNTIGGAIKYVSRELTDTKEGRISITPGSFSNQDIKLSFGGPLVEGKLRGKFAFASLQHDGYGTNLFTGREVSNKDTTAFRLGLDFLASDDVTVKLRYDRTEDDSEPKGLTRLAANGVCTVFYGISCPVLDNFDTESGLPPTNSTDSEGYGLTIIWDINNEWQFKSITAHRETDTQNNIDFDTSPARIVDVFADYFDEQDSQEFQFIYTGGGRLDGVFGFYYFDGLAGGLVRNIFLDGTLFPFPPFPQFGTTDGTTKTESMAIFGDGSYQVNDQLTFNFGARFTEEDKNGRAFNAGYLDDTFAVPVLVTADYDQTETFSSVSPKLGLDYQFNDDVMGYVSLSRGFKSGGFNVRAQTLFVPKTGEPFKDEELTVAEVGVKSVLANRSLVLNAAVFTGDYTDVQVSTFTEFDSDGDGTAESFLGDFVNAGDATLNGLEVEFDWKSPTVSWLGVSGNVSFLDTSENFVDTDNNTLADVQVITNAPEFTGALFLNVNQAAWGGLVSGKIGFSYRDDSELTNEGNGTTPIVQEAFDLLNASIGWLSGDGDWSITINGKNLTDEVYLTNGYNIPSLAILTGSLGQPRTVTATFGYKFW
ncbi:MAG: TonB-dependent receptor [Acidobacteriota bacterium]|nr:TonB-dependent receptor [Acidobacteriota bacterium]